MSYRAWKQWLLSLPWSLRWFVLLVLIRPIVDALYFLKGISPFLSPLYITGVLTPVLIAASYLSGSFPKKRLSILDVLFGFWAWILLFNALALLIKYGVSLESLEHSLHFITPPLIYFYVRHFIQSKENLLGLITTVLLSSIVPSVMLIYENVFDPVSTQTSRDLTRFLGVWSDISNYGVFFTTGLLAAGYFFFAKGTGVPNRRRTQVLAAVIIIGLLGLVSINHTASWIVFIFVFALFMWHGAGSQAALTTLVVLVVAAVGYLFLGEAINESVGTIFEREMNVIHREDKGFKDAFHGRGHRWAAFLSMWETMPALSKLFGVSFGTLDLRWQAVPVRYMTLKGAHSDYIRLLFATGVVGLATYLFALGAASFRSLTLPKAERFLILGGVAILMLFSVSMTPSLYATTQYICFSIVAYTALPRSVQVEDARSRGHAAATR